MAESDLSVGVRELRGSLTTHLRRAKQGERIIVTIDGRPVAQVGPLEPVTGPTLADLISVGLLEPPRRRDRPLPPAVTELAAGVATSRVLEELRGR